MPVPIRPIKTIFLAPIYAENRKSQIAAIVASILGNQNQPILNTCEDDNAVAKLGGLIQKSLTEKAHHLDMVLQDASDERKPKLILDTNNSNRTEAEVLPFAGRAGSVTSSARMGRGTDIKLDNE